ncbi:MAG TPA: DUF484 family protein [Steroidobacteraceae bacterium]|jgi:hypothetical protein
MTTNQVRGIPTEPMEEQAVAQYLLHHAAFFENHPQLLARLRLQHPRNGSTVSLIERQVDVLRDKIQSQDQKLAEFVQVARANNVLAEKIHRFTRRLLRTSAAGPAVAEIEASLREDFDTFHAVLVLVSSDTAQDDEPQRFLRRVAADDPAFRSFETLFAAGKPRCGQIRDTQREFLFGNEGPDIGSVALIPLGVQTPVGLLALGSVDRDRFHPGMSTEFLWRMGELISDALARA